MTLNSKLVISLVRVDKTWRQTETYKGNFTFQAKSTIRHEVCQQLESGMRDKNREEKVIGCFICDQSFSLSLKTQRKTTFLGICLCTYRQKLSTLNSPYPRRILKSERKRMKEVSRVFKEVQRYEQSFNFKFSTLLGNFSIQIKLRYHHSFGLSSLRFRRHSPRGKFLSIAFPEWLYMKSMLLFASTA